MGVKKYLFVKETKDFYFNPLNKIKWGLDERSASDFHWILIRTPPSMECNSAMIKEHPLRLHHIWRKILMENPILNMDKSMILYYLMNYIENTSNIFWYKYKIVTQFRTWTVFTWTTFQNRRKKSIWRTVPQPPLS